MSAQVEYVGPGWTLAVFQDAHYEESYSLEPDPNWRYVDKRGDVHRYRGGKNPYSSLRWVEDEPEWIDADGEEYPATGHHECRLCGEHVKPGRRSGGSVLIRSAPQTRLTVEFWLDGAELALVQNVTTIEAMTEAIRQILNDRALRESVL